MGGVAIIGAGGVVGARLLEMTALAGRTDIVPVVRAFRSVARSAHLGLTYRIADASRADALQRALSGCDVVVNVTGGRHADIFSTTQTIYTAAAAAGARLLIHLSSALVFGRVERPDLPDDAAPQLDHWMLYARQKGLAEQFLRERMADERLAIVVLRPGLVWGPGSPAVVRPAYELAHGTAYLVADGRGICNLMFVDDLVRNIDAVIAHGAPPSGFYHVSDDATTTWREYYAGLASGLGVDLATIHMLPADSYRPSLRDTLAGIRLHPAYTWLKDRVAIETRALIKLRLARALRQDRPSMPDSTGRPMPDRLWWDMQSTCYPLPTAKFRMTFGRQKPDSFVRGLAASLGWLRFIGLDERAAASAFREDPEEVALVAGQGR